LDTAFFIYCVPASPAVVIRIMRCDIEMHDCCVVDNMPNVLWIWNIPKLRLAAVLIQLSPIRSE